MEWEHRTEEIIIGIEVDSMCDVIGGGYEIVSLKITTNNHGRSFLLSYSEGAKLKVGDTIIMEMKLK